MHSTFSLELSPTDPAAALGFEVWIDDQRVVDIDCVTHVQTVTGVLPDDGVEKSHVMKFVLKNKKIEHTQLSSTGEIVKDACLEITRVAFDGIELGHLLAKLSYYEHDFNGTQASTKQNFFDVMGCNGTVTLSFSTPIYFWLLENL